MNATIINLATVRALAVVTIGSLVLGLFAVLPAQTAEAAVVPSCTVASDATTKEGGSNSVESDTETLPGSWASISGAKWIWGDADFLNAPAGAQTFTKKFIVNGTSTSAQLSLLADNQYHIFVNGSAAGGDEGALNFGLVSTRDITSNLIMNAENTIEIEVINNDGPGVNPAGLAFKIEMTGNTCEPLPPPVVDVCDNVSGNQATLPGGYTKDGSACYPIVNITGNDRPQKCLGSENLLTNGSFEEPAVKTGYSVLGSIAGWVSSVVNDSFEIWNNQNGAAADLNQHLELDVVSATTISQSVVTTPGNVYQVAVSFSPRSGTNPADNQVGISFGGTQIGTMSADGTPYSQNVWSSAVFTASATTSSTLLELADLGTSNGLGTLIDDVRVCLVEDNTTEVPPYTISGFKFNDVNADGEFTNDEEKLANWEILLTDSDGGVTYDTTDSSGNYSFAVEPGSYQVTETQQKGWEQTATIGDGADGPICFINVGDDSGEIRGDGEGFSGEFGRRNYTCDFGNHQVKVNQCEGTFTTNLLANGSFETPLVDPESDGWDIFDSVVDGLAWVVTWINPATEAPEVPKLELQDGRPASNGNQYAELDSNYTQPGAPQILGDARVKIAQTIPTVIGEEYTFKFDLSAIPGRRGGPGNNAVDVIVGGVVIDTKTADGRLATSTNWSAYSYTFTATTSATEVALADAGRSNTFGTFVDNVSLFGCVAEDGGGDNETPTRRGGGGSGTRVKRAPTGEVLGASVSTPTGQVLGDATSTLPVGAPNTGAGGTSTLVVQLPSIVAVLPKTQKIK